MKKTTKWLIALALLACMIALGVTAASAETEGHYTYTVSNGEATITQASSSISGDVTIPSTLGGYPVTSIGDSAFSDCSGLTSISIPDSVTSIGNSAFYYCSGLTSITFKDNSQLKSIGSNAFFFCSNLTNITIPEGVTRIGVDAFYNCSSLTSITIPNSVTSIGSYAFRHCSGLTSITVEQGNAVYHSAGNCLIRTSRKMLVAGCKNSVIPTDGSVTSIGECAFSGCRALTSITIPDSVTSIGSNAFYGCSGLTSISIPSSVTSIGSGAFYYCSGLTSISIPSSVTSIGNSAFYECSGLTSITIPSSVTSIGSYAFWNCSSLTYNIYDNAKYLGNANNPYHALISATSTSITSIAIHLNTKVIANFAFENCENLTSITIPDSVMNIGNQAFYNCSRLTSISVEQGNAAYHSAGNCLIETATKTLMVGCRNSIIPTDGSVTSIGSSAFHGCSGLTSITIPDSVTSIGSYAFQGCSNLTSITLPDSVTSIGGVAFNNCSTLTNITIPSSVTSIDFATFHNCSGLTSITFKSPDTVIYDNPYTISSTAAIYGYTGSTAEAYAEKYSRTFIKFILYGDANGDYKINGKDILTIRKYLANYDYDTGTSTVEIGAGADANGDGEISGKDILIIRKYLANYDYDTGESTIVLGPPDPYDLYWDKYTAQANEWAEAILADYIAVVDATLNDTNAASYYNAVGTSPTVLTSNAFVKSFFEGDAKDTYVNDMYRALEHNFEKDYLEKFYMNNGSAWHVDTANTLGKADIAYALYFANPVNTIRENAEDIKVRLTGAMIETLMAIISAKKEAIKATGVPVEEAFYAILKQAIANMEEIYDRFLLDDYKAMVINDMAVKSDAIIDFYATAVCDKTLLKNGMHHYLTGVSNPLVNSGDSAFGGTVNRDENGLITSIVYGTNIVNDTLSNGQFITNLSAVRVNKYHTTTDKIAAVAMERIEDYAALATEIIENVVIKSNFLDYLNTAHTSGVELWNSYRNVAQAYDSQNYVMLVNIERLRIIVEDTISINEFNHHTNRFDLRDYKFAYKEILALITDKDNPHIALLSGASIEEILVNGAALTAEIVKKDMAKIRSSLDLPINEDGEVAVWATDKAPLTPYGQHSQNPTVDYPYIGTAAIDIDKVVNVNTAYIQNGVEVNLY